MPHQPPHTEQDQQTEARILEAAHRVFMRRGMAGARTQDIADEAGVNRALINYYFRSKEKLADAVFLRAAQSLFPGLMRTLAADIPLRDKLQQAIDLELDMLTANPYLPSYVLSELQYNPEHLRSLISQAAPLEQMRTHVLKSLQAQLDAEAEAGHLRPTQAEDLVVMLMSLLVFPFVAAGMMEILLGLDEDARRAQHERRRTDLAAFILNGLRP